MTIEELEEKVQEGDAAAKYELGRKFFEGNGVKKDVPKAFGLFVESAKGGCKEAQAYVAYFVHEGIVAEKNEETSMPVLVSLCRENLDVAYELTGMIYLREKKFQKAISCFKREKLINDSPKADYLLEIAIKKQNEYVPEPQETEKESNFMWKLIAGIAALVAIFTILVVSLKDREQKAVMPSETSEAVAEKQSGSEKAEEPTETGLFSQYKDMLISEYKMTDDDLTDTFANALMSLSQGKLPVGISADDVDTEKMFNSFSVADTDGDGAFELVLVYDEPGVLYMSECILGYDPKTSKLFMAYNGVPYVDIFSDGSIVCKTESAQESAEDFIPYQIYRYDSVSQKYKLVSFVEKIKKDFPEEKDANSDGQVYAIYDEEFTKTYQDEIPTELVPDENKRIELKMGTLLTP